MADPDRLESAVDWLRWDDSALSSLAKGSPLRRFVVLLLFILLALKVAATLARGPVAIEMDALGYWRLSSLVMSGDLLMLGEPIAYRTPGYPYFLAIIRIFSGPWALLTTVVIQGGLTLASLWIAGRIAVRITKLPLAMPLTLLAALPAVSALTFVAAILSESLFIFLLMLNLLAVIDYATHGTKCRASWIGVTLAVTLLTRPIVLLLWIPHVVFLLFIHVRRRWQRRRRLRHLRVGDQIRLHHQIDHAAHLRLGHAAIAALAALLLVAPWLVRNHHLFGSPLLTEFVGRNVWIVTFQDGSGAGLELPATAASEKLQWRLANVGASDAWRNTWSVSNALVASGLNDAQADRLMKRVAVDAISNHREAFAKKAFRRVVNFWRSAATDLPQQGDIANDHGQYTWRSSVPPIDWAINYRLSQSVWGNTLLTVVLAVATAVLIINSPTRPHGLWIFLIFSYFAIVTGVLEIPAYRYRVVIEPLAAMTIGAATAVVLSWRRKPAAVEMAR